MKTLRVYRGATTCNGAEQIVEIVTHSATAETVNDSGSMPAESATGEGDSLTSSASVETTSSEETDARSSSKSFVSVLRSHRVNRMAATREHPTPKIAYMMKRMRKIVKMRF